MCSHKTIVGIGTTGEEALLYARVNQCCIDKGVKNGTISKKTEAIEITNKISALDNSCSKIIMAIHFAVGYYKFQQQKYSNSEFSESDYKYFSILIKALGKDIFNKLMETYIDSNSSTAIVIKDFDNYYKILF